MKKKMFKVIKFFFVACFTFLLIDCNGQTKQQDDRHSPMISIKNVNPIEKFDIETFNKHQQNDSYAFNLRDSHVLQLVMEMAMRRK